MTGAAIFLISLILVALFRGKYKAKELIVDGAIGAVAVLFFFAGYFLAHVILFSPSEIYLEQNTMIASQNGEISTLTNKLQSLKDENSDLFDSSRPQLDPVLVIDSVNSNLVAYYFEVNNLGKTTGVDITFYEDRADYRGGSFTNGRNSWHLAPGAKMSINTPMPMTLLQSDDVFLTDLTLKYCLVRGGVATNFTSLFRYAIPKKMLHSGRFFYIWSEDDSSVTKPSGLDDVQKQIEMPQGSIGITMVGHKLSSIVASKRRLVYDPINNFVEFDNINSDGTLVSLTRSTLDTENGHHFIFFSWGTNYASLEADVLTNIVTWRPKSK